MSIIPNLTGLRGIAALLVVIYHYSKLQTGFSPRELSGIIGQGYLMVDLFFVLSGIVMAHVYGNELLKGKINTYFKFIWARISRLWPVIATSLGIVAFILLPSFINILSTGDISSENLEKTGIMNWLLGFVFLGGDAINGPLWSVIAEFWVYPLLLPLLFIWRFPKAVILTIFTITLTWPLWGEYILNIQTNGWEGFEAYYRCFGGFLTGVLGYKILQIYPKITEIISHKYVMALLAISIFASMSFFLNPAISMVLIYLFVIGSSRLNTNTVISKILEHKITLWLGHISFSLYAIHEPLKFISLSAFADQMQDPMMRSILLIGTLLFSLIAAHMIKERIEDPGNKALKRIFVKKKPETQTV